MDEYVDWVWNFLALKHASFRGNSVECRGVCSL